MENLVNATGTPPPIMPPAPVSSQLVVAAAPSGGDGLVKWVKQNPLLVGVSALVLIAVCVLIYKLLLSNGSD
ncbi:hypothetical protein QKT49_gp383 [Acanthamoeba castellanii medusavirus]|uniref:Uncharacterized protein n=1 Tax=Acanthamoeba castellanii medusavirus J1 TaxID=3114988 RepID=A0A3T1CX16_9VIRU|nr:hypothetical protein QKT49_gp383 [Acanthamoeba castellanii medusavirus]BBI30380.1 hypothetical protein [Acanthamoeba castellanii medusavirus J1]